MQTLVIQRFVAQRLLGPALRTPDQASCPGSVSHAAIAAQVIGSVASYAIHA